MLGAFQAEEETRNKTTKNVAKCSTKTHRFAISLCTVCFSLFHMYGCFFVLAQATKREREQQQQREW